MALEKLTVVSFNKITKIICIRRFSSDINFIIQLSTHKKNILNYLKKISNNNNTF